MLKRKQPTPPESPAPSKRPLRSRSPIPVGANGQPLEIVPGKGEQLSKLPNVTKQKIGQPHASVSAAVQADQGVKNSDKDSELPRSSSAGETATTTTTLQVENISHGQLVAPEPTADDGTTTVCTTTSTAPPKPPTAEQCKQLKLQAHIVPTHAGWFSWTGIHPLERRGLPEFFDGKNKVKTPELYVEYRNFVVQKYRESPEKILSVSDIQDLVADPNAVRRIIEFLDHWGLINYHVTSRPGQCHPAWLGEPAKIEENGAGELHAVPHSGPPSSSLYQFDNMHTPLKSGIVEPDIFELASTPGPSVKYHCNACTADCSKRRYHCQKQADFDLCPDCYNDGKFGAGISTADFIRLDAFSDSNSDDGWSDQETLLLLEGLELYGDNWNEIAEHVATKSKAQCILHFIKMPIEDPFLEDVENSGAFPKPKGSEHETPKKDDDRLDSVARAIMDASAAVDGLSNSDGLVAFSDAGNPVMAQVAFLAAMVGPRVAAAAAQSALMALSEEDPASQLASRATFLLEAPSVTPLPPTLDRIENSKNDDERDGKSLEDGHGSNENNSKDDTKSEAPSKQDRGKPPSAERVRNAAATALAAASVKAKLLADQEEREMQRLVASVVENQLKKIETKLKQFGELEVMLKREYDQIEKARARHFRERAGLLASRVAPPPGGMPPGAQGTPPPGAAATITMDASQQQQLQQQQLGLLQQQQHQQQLQMAAASSAAALQASLLLSQFNTNKAGVQSGGPLPLSGGGPLMPGPGPHASGLVQRPPAVFSFGPGVGGGVVVPRPGSTSSYPAGPPVNN